MNHVFEAFNEGQLALPNLILGFDQIPWSNHPTFEGVELKHIVTGDQTSGEFSFHLVRIAPNKEIGLHTHTLQLETHEVIAGEGICINEEVSLNYTPGTISILPKNVPHKVMAGPNGLYLFAKFFPALC